MELVEEFERNYSREEEEEVRWQEAREDKKAFNRELPGRYMAKLLYGWGDKKYDQEYWTHMGKTGDGGRKIHSLGIVGIHS